MQFDTNTSRKQILNQQEKMLSKLALKVGTRKWPEFNTARHDPSSFDITFKKKGSIIPEKKKRDQALVFVCSSSNEHW
jgi:hypothetical protein